MSCSPDKGNESVDDRLNAFKSKERNEEWFANASSKLCPIFQKLKKLTSSNSTQIRKELYNLSDVLLRHCQRFVVSLEYFVINFPKYDSFAISF